MYFYSGLGIERELEEEADEIWSFFFRREVFEMSRKDVLDRFTEGGEGANTSLSLLFSLSLFFFFFFLKLRSSFGCHFFIERPVELTVKLREEERSDIERIECRTLISQWTCKILVEWIISLGIRMQRKTRHDRWGKEVESITNGYVWIWSASCVHTTYLYGWLATSSPPCIACFYVAFALWKPLERKESSPLLRKGKLEFRIAIRLSKVDRNKSRQECFE